MSRRRSRPVSNGNGNHGFNLATLVQIGLIPIITAGVAFLLQWGVVGDQLKRHENDLTQTIPKQFQQESDAIAAEAKARQQNRDEFLDKLGQVKDGVNELNTTVKLQAAEQKHATDTLDQISHQLENTTITKGR